MTREQVIDIWQFKAMRPLADALRKVMRESDDVDVVIDAIADRMIDGFIELGMLKLDEPESADERATRKAIETIDKRGWSRAILNIFDEAGLKIVEK